MTPAIRETYGIAVPLAFAAATGLAALVWLFADPAQGPVAVRALAAAALPLWSLDVAETHMLRARGQRWHAADRLAMALHDGLSALVFMLLFLGPRDAVVLVSVGIGCAVGALFRQTGGRIPERIAARYDTGRGRGAAETPLWHLWPVLATAALVGMIFHPPEGGWTGAFIYAQGVLLVGIGRTYPVRSGVPRALHPMTAKLAGVTLLSSAIGAGYLSL